jgi:hypothetical protein
MNKVRLPTLPTRVKLSGTDRRTTVQDAKNTNVGPRVSFAYRLSDRFVLRGGYGEFTDGVPYRTGNRKGLAGGAAGGFETATRLVVVG